MDEEEMKDIEMDDDTSPQFGKDEMNLAEFPLSVISDRTNQDQKTLTFEDTMWDESRDEMVTRKLTITGSDEYGLPTSLDDEMVLGLIRLSTFNNFADRKVHFTRYQLIDVLGWRKESKSYDRLETSFKRWLGVTLHYENAWRDKREQSWKSEGFHIIDNFALQDGSQGRKKRDGQRSLPLSSFTWNEVMFKSFTDGNLKKLDFDFYRSLDSAIAKRLYRFLDKRFFLKKRWEFDLKEFCWEHIGLSRNYDAANLKRKLLPAIDELVNAKFLVAMAPSERFRKVRSGGWRVEFQRCVKPKAAISALRNTQRQKLLDALIERGVTPSTASSTVAMYSAEKVATQLEVFDWHMAQPESKRPRNPPGFLIDSIKSEYIAPTNFESRDAVAKREMDAAERRRKAEERAKAEQLKIEAKQKAKVATLASYWDSLSDGERKQQEQEALEDAQPLQRRLIEGGGSFAKTTKQVVLDAYALKMLQKSA